MNLYDQISFKTSRQITNAYSTSFSFSTRLFDKETQEAIYNIYGFVRIADEIVDTFHNYNKRYLLDKFEADYNEAIEQGISTNPVLHSFQHTVKKYNIPDEHVRAFLKSMRSDLEKVSYRNQSEIDEYIYGSADVVGLMCLRVFCNGNMNLYNQLEVPAMKLGSAFQKVNFLRDLNTDINELGRLYFPELDGKELNEDVKHLLVSAIENDFEIAYFGIKLLPKRSKLAVLIAYYYYRELLRRIQRKSVKELLSTRIHVPTSYKMFFFMKAAVDYKLKLV